jgi:hypothetical protein
MSTVLGRTTLEIHVCFDGAVLGVHHLRPGEGLVFGPFSAAAPPDYPVEGLDGPLCVARHGAVCEIAFPREASGAVKLPDGSARTLRQLADSGLCQDEGPALRYALPEGAQAQFSVCGLDLRVARTVLPERTVPPSPPIDWRAQRYTAGSALAFSVVLGLAFLMPPDPRALASNDLSRLDNRTLAARFVPPVVEFKVQPAPAKSGGGGQKPVAGLPGRAGVPDRPRHIVPRVVKPAEVTKLSGSDLEKLARTAGVLSMLGQEKLNGPLSQLFDRNQSLLGRDAEMVLNGLQATETEMGWGTTGASLVQTGPGKGGGCVGPDCTTIGVTLDRICTGANCDGGPGGGGKGPRGAGLLTPRKRTEAPDPVPGPTTVIGGLDREIIRRVIRAHMNEFRYCYERELVRAPELSGRVVTSFIIGRDGRVMTAGTRESTMPPSGVPGCLSQILQRLSFPAPEGGGIVQVSYPFLFQPAGR